MIGHDDLSLNIETSEDGNPFSTIQLESSTSPDNIDNAEDGNRRAIDGGGAVANGDGDFGPNDDFYTSQPGDAISGAKSKKILPNKRISLAFIVAGIFFLVLGISVSKSGKKHSESHNSLKDKKEQDSTRPVVAPGSMVPPESTPAPTPDLLSYLSDTLGQKSVLVEGLFPFDAYTWLMGDSKLATYTPERIKQRYASVCIYLATNYDDTWISDDGWMTEDHECTWFGVNCNDAGQIASLKLSGNGLQGEIPGQIGFLGQNLVTLDISVNELSNQDIGLAWLGELTNLYVLDMQYTNFAADGVPTYIGLLTNLRVLDISYTTFYGPLDGSIFKPLQELVYLEMGGNWYNSTFPMAIARLPKLEALYVDDTNLQGDIEFIHVMSSIFEIWLDNNPVLGGTIPTEIGLHRDLSSMSLTNCNITGTIPTELGNLMSMQQMWLFGNDLEGTIPSEIGQLEHLKILQIEDNYLTGPMPSGICDLKDADDGLLALGADCEDSAWVNCTCCTCCEAPCAVVNMPLTRRILQEEVITMGKMDRLARKLFSFDDLLLS